MIKKILSVAILSVVSAGAMANHYESPHAPEPFDVKKNVAPQCTVVLTTTKVSIADSDDGSDITVANSIHASVSANYTNYGSDAATLNKPENQHRVSLNGSYASKSDGAFLLVNGSKGQQEQLKWFVKAENTDTTFLAQDTPSGFDQEHHGAQMLMPQKQALFLNKSVDQPASVLVGTTFMDSNVELESGNWATKDAMITVECADFPRYNPNA